MTKKSSPYKKVSTKPHARFSSLNKFVLCFMLACISFSVTTSVIKGKSPHAPCANSNSCISDLSEKIENNTTGMFLGRTMPAPTIFPELDALATSSVLGVSTTSGEKHIYVDLSRQMLYAYQGKTLVFNTLISSGKWNKTPVGNFHIWAKLRSTRMSGGEGADAYNLPNVPYVMYFYHDFGLHGAYWHDNFGHVMSHGCVNMRSIDAKTVYDWADGPTKDTLGTAVSICNQITSKNQCVQNSPIQS